MHPAVGSPHRIYSGLTIAEIAAEVMRMHLVDGFFVPTPTSDSIVARLNAEINEAVRADDVHEKLKSIGFNRVEQTPLEAADFFKSELVKWDKIVRAIGFSVD
jgi:tripartite-type tricarboxylate transporter receptor subunit TctC